MNSLRNTLNKYVLTCTDYVPRLIPSVECPSHNTDTTRFQKCAPIPCMHVCTRMHMCVHVHAKQDETGGIVPMTLGLNYAPSPPEGPKKFIFRAGKIASSLAKILPRPYFTLSLHIRLATS